MKIYIRTTLITRYAAQPPPRPVKAENENSGITAFTAYPLRAVIRRFHRLATLLLVVLMGSAVVIWLMMRVIYPQQPAHNDDLSGYEMLFPGERTDPKDFGFQELQRGSRTELSIKPPPEKLQTQFYVNPPGAHQLVIIAVSTQNKQIFSFIYYSGHLNLVDLVWRWGRPDYKQKDVMGQYWLIKWFKNQFNVSITCRKLNLNNPVAMVTITLD